MSRVIFTCGDINGIGPEIAIKLFSKLFASKSKRALAFICPLNVFEYYYKLLKVDFKYHLYNNELRNGLSLNLIPLDNSKLIIGKATKDSGKAAYQSIVKSIELVKEGLADVLVTAPISKTAFNIAGIKFPGHTELLAESEKQKKFLMMFLSKKVNAALLTIHNPLKDISSLLSKEKIIDALDIIQKTATRDLGIQNPRIAVLGLNPHAGENGNIGSEEKEIITPVIKLSGKRMNIAGPFVPDAFWGAKFYKQFDFVLGMYHDQVLIPFKLMNFERGVNYTAGLKIIRTSPDHGTAFDIAGKGIANETSIQEAYRIALKIHSNRKRTIEEEKAY
ncbi:MAG: 4-hydroxythreonine-4-phosphate dehydrogenase PdxA [Ignavibacterium sp.]|jgi:4-hydroxythreonine-4-phosphate dehydrogenase|nr:MAG: 4-hydroxythreonine-4-phosphate dehydrogenase PdxA [Ignavibacterium sp.]MDD5606930.1 4-hydroxythreonine-4-phosphate dehydrogenase PdxA [Ignavibacterium sp.]MDX9712948.1 4-hydroxythreonine-4-phosphate dehydrogenase PdxA [Ignavibacteriaceae bacterium]GIK22896.1 MAG: 4-hydroxythreonine-4-phosphate dehydrogenase [Ignavibacteriota bacterium]